MDNKTKMKTLLIFLTTLVLVTCSPSPSPDPQPQPRDPIKRVSKQLESSSGNVAKIFEVDALNRVIRPYTDINEKSETVLKDVDRIRLECTSDTHPVQWLYQGYGAPILTSNVTLSRLKGRTGESTTEYVATALISPAKEHHTGKYICSSTEQFDDQTHFYIYVPGPTLFSALNGQDIYIPKNDTKILFPCTTSNPDVMVTLEKSVNDVLQRVKPSLWTYDPKEGVLVDIKEIDEPEGIYVCTARYNNLVRGIEYNLQSPTSRPRVSPENSDLSSSSGEKCDLKCGDNAHCELTGTTKQCVCDPRFLGNPNEACSLDCKGHGDCPQNTVCFSDLKCRNPCVHSIRCGTGAECRVENAYPVCFCPENSVGDPKKECFNAVQQDRPSPSALNSSSSSAPGCSRKCGDNAYCTFVRGKESCKCRPGLVECDIPCDSHDDCPEDLSCNTLRKCHSPCIHNIRCGTGANCQVLNHRPKCFCPNDGSGDPMKECSSKSEYQGDQPPPSPPRGGGDASPAPSPTPDAAKDKCSKDDECKPNEKCMKPGVEMGKQCFDPCLTRRCGKDAICRTEDHYTFCFCRDGFEGNANRECRPIKYSSGVVEPLRRRPEEVRCRKPEECGPNSKCTLDKDGKQKCECLEGHKGSPPNCQVECERNADCPTDTICLRDSRLQFPYCARVCGKKICGVHSTCREQNGVIPSDCECPVGYGGDPYLRCQNLNEKLGQDCQMDEDCGSSLRCETGATFRKCVDPCDRMECGRNLECSVRNHQATCVCPQGYTGNPSIGCTKDLDLNATALQNPCGALRCGLHSECRMDSNGQPSCACRSYARGEPPSCYQECRSSQDCELGLSCVQKQCRHACSRCGLNTKCIISRNPKQESVCSCIDGYEGDPTVECKAVE